MPRALSYKQVTFTLNNYTNEEEESIKLFFTQKTEYAIYGKEVGESGTPHLQGFMRFASRYLFQKLKTDFNSRAHIEGANGSVLQNITYCSKDGNIHEYGKRPMPKRTRDEVAESFTTHAKKYNPGLREFAQEHPAHWAFNGTTMLRNYMAIQPPVDRANVNVRWYVGKPGVGKSRRAHEELPDAYIKEPRTKWWNGYVLEPDVIIDDFGPNGIDINHLLRWFDRYKCLVENKGGMIPLYVVNWIVTSNFTPEEVFTDNLGCPHVQLPALLRRVNVIHM